MDRPVDMFDREAEWAALARFCTDTTPGAALGVVTGRRRQGKSFLLEAACESNGGLYFQAIEATAAESLRLWGAHVAQYLRAPAPIAFPDWGAAVDALLALGEAGPTTVVLDEFPYLMKAAPELPSVVQAAFGPRRAERTRSRTRLLLCGSALSVMGKLLAGAAPLRGRASLELAVPTFDYRLARRFWGIGDRRLAALVFTTVGGTPAYRDFLRGDAPADLADFDAWVVRAILDPSSPLFREARYLLSEEPDLRDGALYSSVLDAVASGASTRSGIASHIGRSSADLAHVLTVLVDAGLLSREENLLRDRRPIWTVDEPLVSFYHAVSRPVFSQLARPGNAARIWPAVSATFASRVLGPRFEQMCRTWVSEFADPATTLGTALVGDVGHGTVHDHAGRATVELDVVALGPADGSTRRLVALGEAKWGTVLGTDHADRLRRARDLIGAVRGYDVADTRSLLFSAAGFSDDLRALAERDPTVVLVDLERLYEGS